MTDTSKLVRRLLVDLDNFIDAKTAADRLEALDRALDTAKAHIADLEPEVTRLREALADMLDLAEMLAGNEGWDTYKARFNFARAALKGET